jgi:fatty-acyl-CoA synthase
VTKFFGPPAVEEHGIGALTMGGLLEEVATKYPKREALCLGDAESTTIRWTYEDLQECSRRLAKALVAAGAHKGTRVGVLMGNRPEWVQCAFAASLAGCVLVPVNSLYEAPEIEHVLRNSDCSIVLNQEGLGRHRYDDELRAMEEGLPYLTQRYCLGTSRYEDLMSSADEVDDDLLFGRASEVSPFDDGLIIYTSGSTGRPKGVLHAHRAAAIQSWRFADQLCLEETVRVWSAFPFFWTAGFCMVMGATLAAGGCLVMEELFHPETALRLIERERVTTPHAWPHQLAALETDSNWEKTDLSSLRHVEPFTIWARHPSVATGDPWSPRAAYGLTETFTIVSSTRACTPQSEREGHEGPILPGNCLRIVDAATGAELPAGETGVIGLKGPTLMKGYVKVSPDEVFDEEGFFVTEDAGFVDELGRLHWAGRIGDLIKTGGANVSPVEIDNELLFHPDLEAARAVGLPHPTLGQIVVVCAVPRKGASVTEKDVRDFLVGKLASYKLPRQVLFFDEDELVLTTNDKIRLDELRALAESRLRADGAAG